jgi:hypothetical protein
MIDLLKNRLSYWVRGLAYGTLCSVALVVAVALAFAVVRNEQPINQHKGASALSINTARRKALPIAVPTGAVVGVVVAEYLWRIKGRRQPTH